MVGAHRCLTMIIILILLLPTVPVQTYSMSESSQGEILISPIPGLSQGFIRGVDLSEVPWILELGGKYYDYNGVERDILDILSENNVNWIRLRVWNDPYDEQGNPYGGGNCDLVRMTSFAAKAKEKGFKIMIDFHYSDWWADPGKQNKPKAWANLSFSELVKAIYDYTYSSLRYMEQNGALPHMVQVGNEINNGFLWPDGRAENWTQFVALLKSAIKAVRDVDPGIIVAIHLSGQREVDYYVNFYGRLINSGVDYDVIALSYYLYWHGDLGKLSNLVSTLVQKFGKPIVLAEIAYPWTLQDADGAPNLFGSRDMEVRGGYLATVQGQATAIRDTIATLFQAAGDKAMGVFYWGAGWIPWPGAGWKTGEGNPWENQALFDFSGRALPSLQVFKLIYMGQQVEPVPRKLYNDESVNVTAYVGTRPELPDSLLVVYTDDSIRKTPVDWGDLPVFNQTGVYELRGYISGTNLTVIARIQIEEKISLEIVDPEGDDSGPGVYRYPTANVFARGVYDIVAVKIWVEGENVVLRVYFKDLGGNPWSGPNGFSLQYIHVYIRTTTPAPTNRVYRTDTYGLNIVLNENYAWQYALLITPGWGTDPLPGGELSALIYSNGTVFVEDRDFHVSANTNENYIEARIPRSLLPDWQNLKMWRVLVASTSWAGENTDRIRPFAPGGGEWVVDATGYANSTTRAKISAAIISGVLPKLLDIAIYSDEYPQGITANQQYDWLMSFDPAKAKMATVPPVESLTVTITYTTTVTTTLTTTVTEREATPPTEIPAWSLFTTAFLLVGLGAGLLIGYLASIRTKRKI